MRWPWSSVRMGQRGQARQKPRSLYNLISEVTSHHMFHFLWVRGPHSRGGDYTKMGSPGPGAHGRPSWEQLTTSSPSLPHSVPSPGPHKTWRFPRAHCLSILPSPCEFVHSLHNSDRWCQSLLISLSTFLLLSQLGPRQLTTLSKTSHCIL